MKKVLSLGVLMFCVARVASATPIPITTMTIAVDEFGAAINATRVGTGSTSLNNPLTYALPSTVVEGYIQLCEPANGQQGCNNDSDVIRFRNVTVNNILVGRLIFYSTTGDPALADTGLPQNLNGNIAEYIEIGTEASNYYDYTPTSNQPGYFNVNNTVPKYHLVSDGVVSSPVPEPASMTLLGTGLLGLVRFARRRTL